MHKRLWWSAACALLVLAAPCGTASARPLENALAERLEAAVVRVSSERGTGSGFFFGSGWVMTAYHLVGNARNVRVRTLEGQTAAAALVRFDVSADLAVLKTELRVRTPLTFADSFTGADVLDPVFAAGFLASGAFAVTDGIISGFRRLGRDLELVLHTAPLEAGLLGGPLVNRAGRVVGVLTARALSAGDLLNAAISSNAVRRLILQVPRPVPPLLHAEGTVNRPPRARITPAGGAAPLGGEVTLDGTASQDPDGTVTAYRWDLDGDGAADAFEPRVVFRCERSGQQTVTLEVRDDAGASDTASATLSCEAGGPLPTITRGERLLLVGVLVAALLFVGLVLLQ